MDHRVRHDEHLKRAIAALERERNRLRAAIKSATRSAPARAASAGSGSASVRATPARFRRPNITIDSQAGRQRPLARDRLENAVGAFVAGAVSAILTHPDAHGCYDVPGLACAGDRRDGDAHPRSTFERSEGQSGVRR